MLPALGGAYPQAIKPEFEDAATAFLTMDFVLIIHCSHDISKIDCFAATRQLDLRSRICETRAMPPNCSLNQWLINNL